MYIRVYDHLDKNILSRCVEETLCYTPRARNTNDLMNGNKIGQQRSFPRGSFRFDKSAGRIAFPYCERAYRYTFPPVEDFLGSSNVCCSRMDMPYAYIRMYTSWISMAEYIDGKHKIFLITSIGSLRSDWKNNFTQEY